MARSYNHHGGSTVTVKKGGFFGKIIALLLGIILGITAGLGGLAGAIYHLIVNVPIDNAVGTVESITKTEIDISQVLTDEYASKTVFELVGEIQAVSKEFQEGKGSFNTLNKISPAVKKSVEGLVKEVAKYGLELNVDDLMGVYFKDLGNYLTQEVDSLEIGTLLTKLKVNIDNPILMSICYGEEDVDYTVDENGKVSMIAPSSPTTIGEIKNLGNVLNELTLYSLFNSETFDVHDPIMGALAFGASTHYTIDSNNKVTMNEITFTIDGTHFVDADGNVYDVINDGDNYLATYTDEDGNKTEYNVKLIDGKLCAYDKETGNALRYKRTTVGDLINGNPVDLLKPVKIADLMDVHVKSNKILITLAYGVEDEDYKIENGEIIPINGSTPNSLGTLLGDELSDMLDTLPIASLMEVDTNSELMLALAYGAKSHYDLVDATDDEGNPIKKVVMKEITFTLDEENGKFIEDADKTEYAYTYDANTDTYTLTETVEGEAEPKTYQVRKLNDEDGNPYFVAYDTEKKAAVKYEKTTLSMLQKDPNSILNQIELGAAMNLTPKSNEVLLAIAYGEKNVDYYIDGDKIVPVTPPLTIGDMQNNEKLNSKIENLTLESLLEIDYEDKLICALAFGASSHYEFTYKLDEEGNFTLDDKGNKIKTGVVMNVMEFSYGKETLTDGEGNEYESEFFTDADGEKYVVTEKNGEFYTATYTDEKGTETTYNIKQDADSVYRAYNSNGEQERYKKLTVGMLQKNPEGALDGIALADVLDIKPTSDPILIALAYGNEGEDFEYVLDDEGNKIGFDPKNPPKTLKELKNDPNVFNGLRLATVLNVDVDSDPIMIALAYGNEGVDFDYEYKTDENGKKVDADGNETDDKSKWVKVGFISHTPPRTVLDLQDEDATVIKSIQLATVLDVDPRDEDADPIMVAIAYGNKGEHYDIKDGEIVWYPVEYTLEGNVFTDTNDKNYTATKNGDIWTAVHTDAENGKTETIYIVEQGGKFVAYTSETEQTDKTTVRYSAHTISDLQDNQNVLGDIRLATVLDVDPRDESADPIMVALAYGNKGEHYDIKDGEIVWLRAKYTHTVKDGTHTFTDGNGKEYTATENAGVWTAVYTKGEKTETIYIVEDSGEYVAYTSATSKTDNTAVYYDYRTIQALQDDPELFKSMYLATALNVTVDSDPVMIALAYGNEGVDFDYEYKTDENGDKVAADGTVADDESEWVKVGFISHTPPRTLADLQNNENLIKDIRLATVLKVDAEKVDENGKQTDNAIMLALAYGNKGEHYKLDENGKLVWLKDKNDVPYDYRTIDTLQNNHELFKDIYLATALELTPDSDPIMIELAYGYEGVDFNYIYKTNADGDKVDENGVVTSDESKWVKIDFDTLNTPRKISELQGDSDVFKKIRLATVLKIDAENVDAEGKQTDDALMLALAYGNKDEHYKLGANGKIEWLPITYTLDGNTFTDGNGKEYTATENGGIWTAVHTQDSKTETIYIVEQDGKYVAYTSETTHTDETAVRYDYRTIDTLQSNHELFKDIYLATALELTPSSEPILIALAYGYEGEDFNYIYKTNADGDKVDENGNVTNDESKWVKIGFETINPPAKISELQGDSDAFQKLRIAPVLGVNAENVDADGKQKDDAVMLAIAYGNKDEHYKLVDGKVEWQRVTYSFDEEKNVFTDGNDKDYTATLNDGVWTAVYTKDDKTETVYIVEEGGKYVSYTSATNRTNDTAIYYTYRTVDDMQNNPGVFKSMHLSTAFSLNPTSDPIMIAIVYGNEGDDFNFADGNGDGDTEDKEDLIVPNPNKKPRTIASLEGGNIFQDLRLATVLDVDPLDPNADQIMVALAYGNKGEHYKIVDDKVEWQRVTYTYANEDGTHTFTDGNDKKYTATENGGIWTASHTKDGKTETIYIVEESGKYVAYTSETVHTNDTAVYYSYRILTDIQENSNVIKTMQLATVLNVTPNSNPIMIAIAYGNEGEDFVYTYKTNEHGEKVDELGNVTDDESKWIKTGFDSIRNPSTIGDLQDENATVIKNVRLSAVIDSNYDDHIIMYVVYGGGEGAHYEFTYKTDEYGNFVLDGEGNKIKTGVTMLEKRIGIATIDGVPHVYDEYGAALKATDYTLTDNGDGTFTYTDKDNVTYTAKRSPETETMAVEYKNASKEFISATADVYWLYDGDTLLYYTPATIGDMQDGKDLSDITDHLKIKDLVGESDSKLFQTIGEWRLPDLQDQDRIMTLKIGEVIHIEDDSTGILNAMKDWSLNDLNKQETINSLKISEIIIINSDSPRVLQFMRDDDPDGDPSNGVGWTLADLNSGKFEEVELGNIIEISDDDIFLKHLKNTKVNALSTDLNKLTLTKVFKHKIFAQEIGGTLFVDSDNDGEIDTSASDVGEKITDQTLIDKFNNDEFLKEAGTNYLYTDRNGNGKADEGEYLIGEHIWWYLLHNDKECTQNHGASSDKQCYHPYTLDEINLLIDNMKTNVESATLYQLKADGLIHQLDDDALDSTIRMSVSGVAITGFVLPAGKEKLGHLTVAELLEYVNALLSALPSTP